MQVSSTGTSETTPVVIQHLLPETEVGPQGTCVTAGPAPWRCSVAIG